LVVRWLFVGVFGCHQLPSESQVVVLCTRICTSHISCLFHCWLLSLSQWHCVMVGRLVAAEFHFDTVFELVSVYGHGLLNSVLMCANRPPCYCTRLFLSHLYKLYNFDAPYELVAVWFIICFRFLLINGW